MQVTYMHLKLKSKYFYDIICIILFQNLNTQRDFQKYNDI